MQTIIRINLLKQNFTTATNFKELYVPLCSVKILTFDVLNFQAGLLCTFTFYKSKIRYLYKIFYNLHPDSGFEKSVSKIEIYILELKGDSVDCLVGVGSHGQAVGADSTLGESAFEDEVLPFQEGSPDRQLVLLGASVVPRPFRSFVVFAPPFPVSRVFSLLAFKIWEKQIIKLSNFIV